MISQSCHVANFTENRAHIVAVPNSRGTLTILWSSLFTIFLCTWTVLHLNVPEQPDESKSWLRKTASAIWRKLKWMIGTVMAPEVVLQFAAVQWYYARTEYNDMILKEPALRGSWTLVHAFYANMGGFVLREMPPRSSTETEDRNGGWAIELPPQRIELVELSEAGKAAEPESNLPGPKVAAAPSVPDTTVELKPFIAVNGALLRRLRKMGVIDKFPSLTKAEIQDKSKGDLLVKFGTVLQIIWNCLQLVARKAKGLPVSQLEIGVLAFSLCSIVIYIFWLDKPKDVVTPTYVDVSRRWTKDERNTIIESIPWDLDDDSLPRIGNVQDYPTPTLFRILGRGIDDMETSLIIGAVLFGAPHLLAWHSHFPSHVEQIMWRVAALVVMCVPPLFTLYMLIALKKDELATVETVIIFASIFIYIIARLFLLVEMFRSLFYLPPKAYVTPTWTASIPHFS